VRHMPAEPRQCPHCAVEIAAQPFIAGIGKDGEGDWAILVTTCSNARCGRLIVELIVGIGIYLGGRLVAMDSIGQTLHLVHPRSAARGLLGPEVPDGYRKTCQAAAAIIGDSPEASAALTRRALQQLLVDKAGATRRDLTDQIQEVIDTGSLPSHLAEQLDGIRAIGNFGAHPIKSKATGEIMDVSPGEAEWNLDTLEGLLDWYYVEAAARQRRRDELNARLAEAGKPPVR
jgi:hypothetical protein